MRWSMISPLASNAVKRMPLGCAAQRLGNEEQQILSGVERHDVTRE